MPSPTLDTQLLAISPRYSVPPAAWAGPLIWAGTVALFIALFAQGFIRAGIAAWAVGLVYICYDTGLLLFTAIKTRKIATSGLLPLGTTPPDGCNSAPLRLAVIVAAYNEASVLEVTIEALRAQAQPPELIVIADDGSTDDSVDVLAHVYGLTPPPLGTIGAPGMKAPTLRWLRLSRGGKARALNAAIECIDADVIVTVDADTLLNPGALAAMRRAFATETDLAAATGVLHPLCGPSLSGRIFQWFQTYEYVRNFLSRYAWMEKNSLLLISGAFAGFRRDALVAVGGFDPDCLVEDYEVMHRLHRYSHDRDLGWRVRVIGDAQARTDSPGRLMPFLRQRRRWFAGFLQTQYWNRDMIGNRRFGSLGTAMLPVKSLDTVQPLYGIAAFILLINFIATRSVTIAMPVLIAMAIKVAIDLAYLLWSLRIYRHWTGQRLSPWGALAAAVIEPLTFQLLRHVGAAWGWVVFLTGKQVWGTTGRQGILSQIEREHDRAVDPGNA